ncbi:HAD family hydrolase [Frateuria edaphi]|jgi:HAD superfamily hydrolase (TIGR01509 family)|uniref:HAD family hydrolase n=1 Tax=Frateuria edaphi TaxID=2898793 RepID=UPI001E55EA51|nr:HAD family hydrolase [Frateuria edaphi]UGB46194.1 HAD family hydrolase [Frateuria edaphi]
MNAAPPGLVIFDCDGVLVDSEAIANRVFGRMLAGQGLVLDDAQMDELFLGRTMAHCLALVVERLGGPLPDDFEAEHDRQLFDALAAELAPVPGVVQVLDGLALPYCVASNGGPDKMRFSLGRVGLLPRFEGRLFSAAHVARGKPAPDLFLHAAGRMGVAPAACVVVEDSPAGVAAGVAAGMRVLGFAARTPAVRLREVGAHRVFTSMDALPALLDERVTNAV